MRKLSVLFGFVVLFGVVVAAQADNFVPGQIIVDIKHQYLPIAPTPNGEGMIVTELASLDSLNILHAVYAFEKLVDDSWSATKGFYLLRFPDSLDANQVASSYSSDIHIHLAGPNGIREPYDVVPSDYYFPQQWGLSKMSCPAAWRYTNGSPDIVIQIIDGGTAYDHPDIVHNTWQNLGEDADGDGHTIEWYPVYPDLNIWILDPGDLNHMDDDYNGYWDDLVGFDFRYEPNESLGCDPGGTTPGYGDHGSRVAGTAAAVTDNWISEEEAIPVCSNQTGTVAGTSWFSKIMIAKFAGEDAQAIKAINYGRNNGAKIINMSWGDTEDYSPLHAVLDSAYNDGILLVAAAGNYTYDVPAYPAAYENVIAVAATDDFDVKWDGSNYGNWVDICAPVDNWSPNLIGKWFCYDEWGGTSCAAPFVAGVAALVWSCNLDATNAQVRAALESTADDVCSLPGNQGQPWCYPFNKLGHGRVNALEAVKVFRPDPPAPGDCNHNEIIDQADAIYILNYLFYSGPPPDPYCIGDVNETGMVDLGDTMYIINYLYKGGPPPQDGCD